MDLTAELGGNCPFAAVNAALRYDLPRRDTSFFEGAEKTPVGKELAALNTPRVARRWRFLMNMPFDSFETLFRKTFGASTLSAGS